MSMQQQQSVSLPTKRACDSCHRRKVRCTDAIPHVKKCNHCETSGLLCTFESVPQKKGPKGSRAKVINALKEEQKAKVHHHQAGPPMSIPLPLSPADPQDPTGTSLPWAVREMCVEYYYQHVYPSQPVPQPRYAQSMLLQSQSPRSPDEHSLIAAMCAVVLTKGGMSVPQTYAGDVSSFELGRHFLAESIRVRGTGHLQSPNLSTVLTSFLISSCFHSLGETQEAAAWTSLKEALAQAEILPMMDDEKWTSDSDAYTRHSLCRVLFVAEREHAVHKRRPITLSSRFRRPSADDANGGLRSCLNLLVAQYDTLDVTFFQSLLKQPGETVPAVDEFWASQIHNRLVACIPEHLEPTGTNPDELNVKVTNCWLRSSLWQLSVDAGIIKPGLQGPMSHRYPIDICNEIVAPLHIFLQRPVERYRVSFTQKLFDMACSLLDVVRLTASQNEHNEVLELSFRFNTYVRQLAGESEYCRKLNDKFAEAFPGHQGTPPTAPTALTSGLGNVPSNASEDLIPYAGPSHQYSPLEMNGQAQGRPDAVSSHQYTPLQMNGQQQGQRLVPSNGHQQQPLSGFQQGPLYPHGVSRVAAMPLYASTSPSNAPQPTEMPSRTHQPPGAFGHATGHAQPQHHEQGGYGHSPGLVPSHPTQPQFPPHPYQSQQMHNPDPFIRNFGTEYVPQGPGQMSMMHLDHSNR